MLSEDSIRENMNVLDYIFTRAILGQYTLHESIKKVIDYSTQTLEFKIIDAITHKDNQSSIKLLKNLNFLKTEIDEAEPNLISFRFVEQARTANSA